MTEEVPGAPAHSRLAVLDGWRACSILLVLAAHLLPLGPKSLALNEAAAVMGMVIFFTLSGFLITRFLAAGMDVRSFLIRRIFRIVPLAWVAVIVASLMDRAGAERIIPNLLFYANLPPIRMLPSASHLWSLGAEVQFYLAVALLVGLFGRRGLLALPVLCVGFTGLRVATGTLVSIVTWFRIDEILAGAIVALAYGGQLGERPQRWLARINPMWLPPLVFAASHQALPALNYVRPYLAAAMVGASLYGCPLSLRRLLESRAAHYIATISYALYIIHGVLGSTWLGTGDRIVRYLKRPLLFAVTFALAHLSTFRFEQPCIAFAKRFTGGHATRPPKTIDRSIPGG